MYFLYMVLTNKKNKHRIEKKTFDGDIPILIHILS